jgi:uncharacterized protein YbjQ (UPF0145 family)
MPDPTSPGLAIAIVLLIYAVPVAGLIVFGLVGRARERSHYASIRQREAATAHLPAIPAKRFTFEQPVADARLVIGAVVISHDYFKRFLANLRGIFGGRIRSYETLLDRARREAVLRLKEQCLDASVIAGLRLETHCIGRSSGRKGIVGIEVIAYGTAVRYGR